LLVFGDDDINTLQAANNLAVDLRLIGKFRGATELDERMLIGRRRLLGESQQSCNRTSEVLHLHRRRNRLGRH
jgi:Tetratricopeptide repeat